MKVYTIIVTYNAIRWIDKCLREATKQSEVVVVDNKSSDETVSYIADNFSTVKVMPQQKNLGFGLANNVGINYALKQGADAVLLLNQDAIIQQDCVSNLVKAYTSNREYGIISPVHLNGNGSALDFSFQKLAYMSSLISDLITKNFTKEIYDFKFINAAAWFIPKEVLCIIGGFDPLFFMYGEDDNFSQRVKYHGFKIGVIPNATIFHDSSNSNYRLGTPGSEKYYRQFINTVYVKYANVNTDDNKKLRKLKCYLLKKAFLQLICFNIKMMNVNIKKYKMIDIKSIKNSVYNNRKIKANYLDI